MAFLSHRIQPDFYGKPALYARGAWFMIYSVLTRKFYIYVVFCFTCLTFLAAQASDFDPDAAETAGTMRMWHIAEGLPSDSVTAIIQTRDSFLWIGTAAGLVRFDGVKFTAIKPDTPSANGLTAITALCEDSVGHVWIGTQQNG
ncbi:MAG TPA: two-component regulator propeller domain-containing protein, partial [Verrucomicrobiae bacterium]|nr:two-component regulator propeller domain-containing protein [Verrucomicrobiae bacterium]